VKFFELRSKLVRNQSIANRVENFNYAYSAIIVGVIVAGSIVSVAYQIGTWMSVLMIFLVASASIKLTVLALQRGVTIYDDSVEIHQLIRVISLERAKCRGVKWSKQNGGTLVIVSDDGREISTTIPKPKPDFLFLGEINHLRSTESNVAYQILVKELGVG
jgi:hypothetical protein